MTHHYNVLLVILDGFGYATERRGNAIAQTHMQFFRGFLSQHKHSLLHASGVHVGLPRGMMGNSEVGHLTLGAGRIIPQDCLRINQAIGDGRFYHNPVLRDVFRIARHRTRRVHIIGLLSDAGVHAHISHLLAVLRVATSEHVETLLHLFTDGRDMDPHSAISLLRKVEAALGRGGLIRIATVAGRYYGMDRDKRWRRTERAYDAIVRGKGRHASSGRSAVSAAYAKHESDEFILPTVIGGYKGFEEGDSVFALNFRADRARQICWALKRDGFKAFSCERKEVTLSTMTLYDSNGLVCPVAFPEEAVRNGFAEIVSRKGLHQLHIAETEKYAHVTYFFNGGREQPFPREERVLVPSPKVATYDMQPAMSAAGVTKAALKGVKSGVQFVLVNYANADMVGHTGDFQATKRALKALDGELARLIPTALASGYRVALTADHGNCEQMGPGQRTSHTRSKVPFVLAGARIRGLRSGSLSDVAPTLLRIMNISIPSGMTGKPLMR